MDTDITLPVRARQLPRGRRLAVGTADDHRLHLRAAPAAIYYALSSRYMVGGLTSGCAVVKS